ncbi:FAD/NAD(P)-binding domain-containing protein [Aspergillus karnatakaensis]|uniref:NAD(P)/FAD-dependent oxidoreductase n=1 Tax=Aspergillus karnatakaensis TaxID=1810916 RepID=UPI003CCD3824
MELVVDVLIIGGGPAGLTAASTLVRQNHSAVLFDSQSYRNKDAEYIHMIRIGDHRNPSQFREKARPELLNHYDTVTIIKTQLATARKITDSLFEVADTAGKTWKGRKVIFATGSADIFPDIPGYAEAWVKRIYHCLYWEGYEDRGATSSGVLAIQTASIAPLAIHLAEIAAHLSSTVTIYTHGSDDLALQIQQAGGIELTFADGTTTTEVFLLHNPFTKTNGLFAEQLGVKMTATGEVVADFPAFQTSVHSVFAAGDCVTQYKVIAGAISSGCNAAVAASTQLLAEKYGHQSLV